MLKFLFGALLFANLAVLLASHGTPGGHEPARLSNQLNADRIRLLPLAAAQPAASSGAAEPGAAAAPACLEVGDFTAAEAGRFESRLAALGLAQNLSRREVPVAASYMVMIPPQGSREAADRKTEELRGMGITDTFVVQEDSPRQWAIALGTFRTREAAEAHLATMSRRGVRTARVYELGVGTPRIAVQLRGLDAAAEAQVTRARAEFPRQESRACG